VVVGECTSAGSSAREGQEAMMEAGHSLTITTCARTHRPNPLQAVELEHSDGCEAMDRITLDPLDIRTFVLTKAEP
jgi:hypothetical protein